jgi:predicted metal-dependent phosphoesterase TrpH
VDAAPTFDLQAHSLHSDGALPAAEVVRLAAAAGVELLALTDHDTVGGVDEARAAGRAQGVRVVPAVELSAVHADEDDLHVLGYGIEPGDEALADRLAGARADRDRRAEEMVRRLEELGFAVDTEPLAARHAAGRPPGRPHLAAAVLAHPVNAERLRAEAIGDLDRFIPAYLVPGAPAFVPRRTPSVDEAIGWIHAAGGVAVWAHPFWDIEAAPAVLATLDAFVARGLDGVEAFYVTHTPEQTRLLADHAAARALLATGSSDFHGPDHPRFHAFRAFRLHGGAPRLGPIADAGDGA